ncbi:MAG: hypothetical protein ACI4R8_03015 [Candidatus Caccovivens sp.]
MTSLSIRKIISVVLIVAVALVTGLSVGKIYVDTIEPEQKIVGSEVDFRESEDDILSWVNRAKAGTAPSSFSPMQLYNIAEYNLYHSDGFYKLMTGNVLANAGVVKVNQPMKSEKLFRDGKLIFNKYSPSTSSMAPAICTRMIYDSNTNEIKVNQNGVFNDNPSGKSEDITATFDSNGFKQMTLEEYQEIFFTNPSNVMPYIISEKTCAQHKYSPITKNSDGTYTFTILIDGSYLSAAALCYSYEIAFSSGRGKPTWVSLSMEVTIDSDFNFVKIEYVEQYKVRQEGIGNIPITDTFTDTYRFVDLPSIEYVTGEKEVA